jgi:TPR repeat protein
MYQNGKGIIQNYKEAVRFYRQSAKQGNTLGQKYLGVMYVLG